MSQIRYGCPTCKATGQVIPDSTGNRRCGECHGSGEASGRMRSSGERLEVIIDDNNAHLFTGEVRVHGRPMKRGLWERDHVRYPTGMMAWAQPFDVPLIGEGEQQARLDAQVAAKAQLSDIRNTGKFGGVMPSTDQNGRGYCWCHSGVSAILLVRALQGLPYADLSAYMVGCLVKNYRDEGGWGPAGLEFMVEHGVPESRFWPQRSASRSNDTPEMRANAKLHRPQEWMDLDPRNMRQQLITCCLLNIPVVSDFNWWSHSVCTMDLVAINPFRTRIWNSWGDGWSQNGTGLLEGSKAIPNDAIAPRVIIARDPIPA